ncbi:MAG: Gfo/Idh/MocA family oxidoreductase [Clostridia bacterium]|nr:Gfo/Idh/MocA family oxidoreductase [Clostridia bacterium]
MKTFKSAIIGCGAIFPTHGVSVRLCERAELVAVCDKVMSKAEAVAEKYGCRAYDDYIKMLESEDIDVVHLCLPHYLHAPVAIECMSRGKHVVTEKPMATNVEDARAMIEASEKYGVTLACIFQNRFNAGTQLVRDMYLSGKLGRIKGAKCFVTWNRSETYYKSSDWKGTWDKEGGGVIIDQAIHTLDAVRYIMDSKPVEVNATIAKRGDVNIEVEDTAEGAILFENGIKANFHAINYYSFDDDVQIDMDFELGRARIVSDRATVTMFDGRVFIAEHDPRESVDYGDVKAYWGVNHFKQIDDVYKSIATGSEMFVDLEGSFETLKLVCAIYESGKTGKKVKL